MFFRNLLRPWWKHPDPKIRIREIKLLNDWRLLEQIVNEEMDPEVWKVAREQYEKYHEEEARPRVRVRVE